MKKQNLWLLASLFAGVMAMTACSSSDDDKTVAIGPDYSQPVKPADMKMSSLSGFVFDKNGSPISGVTVTSGTASTRTDGQGGFVLNEVNSGDRTVVKFTHPSYMEIVRAADKVDGDMWEVVMSEYWSDNVNTGYGNSSQAMDLSIDNGMKTELQADGYKNAITGEKFEGSVSSTMLYLDPDDANFGDMMPGGDLAAERTAVNGAENEGQQVQLISYGMTKVDLTDDYGNKLQISKDAKMSFPIPDKFMNSGEPLPAEIPLWSFDEEKGLWIEEGMATLVNNDHYEGNVPHFSWVNLDYPEVRVKLTITVKDDKGNLLPGVKVDIDGQKNMVTNMKGVTSGYVPKGQDFYVTVHSKDYANYTMDGEDSENGEYKVTVPAMSKDGSITITLPTVAHLGGYVINQGSGNNVATVWIEYNGKETKRMHTDEDGKFYIIAPADYQGEAKLKVRGGDGNIKTLDINLNGTDQTNLVVNFKSDVNAGGTGKFVFKGQTYNFFFNEVETETEGGVVIIDDYFSASTGYGKDNLEEGWCMANLEIYGYSATKTNYSGDDISNAYLEMEGGGNGYMSVRLADENPRATITKQGNNYRVQANFKANAEGGDFGWNQQETGDASFDITMPVYARGNALENVTAANNPLPSWIPILTGKTADFGLSITESYMGKGGILMYYDSSITKETLNTLKAQATTTLGEPIYTSDTDVEFFKEGRYLSIRFQDYYNESNKPEEMHINRHHWRRGQGRLVIEAFDDYKYNNGEGVMVKAAR